MLTDFVLGTRPHNIGNKLDHYTDAVPDRHHIDHTFLAHATKPLIRALRAKKRVAKWAASSSGNVCAKPLPPSKQACQDEKLDAALELFDKMLSNDASTSEFFADQGIVGGMFAKFPKESIQRPSQV